MLFNSIEYVFFFPLVVFCYFLLPPNKKRIFLLVASYYFYMCWKPEYVILIFISTVIDYFMAIKMEQQTSKKKKKLFLAISLVSNLGFLFFFKYLDFFNENFAAFLSYFNIFYNVPSFDLLLPVGISFYTFQTLSYSIDVYNGKVKAERHFGIFALFVSFFPQLVAGPIERSSHLLPQFRKEKKFSKENFSEGTKLILWGFFKKVVIADRLAVAVNTAFASPDISGLPLLIAVYFFAFQIYCDFSGYSDIAVGTARILGYDIMKNFNRPYLASSITEFWRRWHISLSTWFRDYVYVALGGNRSNIKIWMRNILIVFLVSGIWHGAAWTFVIWGLYHGILIIIERVFVKKFSNNFFTIFNTLILFHLVLVGWVFFRAVSCTHAFGIFYRIGKDVFFDLYSLSHGFQSYITYLPLGISKFNFFISFFAIAFLIMVEVFEEKVKNLNDYSLVIYIGKLIFYDFLFFAILFLGVFNNQEFIYFQF